MDHPPLPFDATTIEGLLPHRYPFLFVDRITEFEPERRIVGVKHVAHDEHVLARHAGVRPALPATVLMEAVAQVGAILALLSPTLRGRLIFLLGIKRVRVRGAVYAGDTATIEAVVISLRGEVGRMRGTVTVDGRVVAEGVMQFAVGPDARRR